MTFSFQKERVIIIPSCIDVADDATSVTTFIRQIPDRICYFYRVICFLGGFNGRTEEILLAEAEEGFFQEA